MSYQRGVTTYLDSTGNHGFATGNKVFEALYLYFIISYDSHISYKGNKNTVKLMK